MDIMNINFISISNPFEAFGYSFFIRALIAVVLLSVVLPFIGIRLSSKGFSMVADTLSHTSLAGIAIGLATGTMPLLFSIIFSVVCSLLIELFRRKMPKLADISLAIILCFSLGLTGILSQFTASSRFESYLFGSLFTVNLTELIVLAVIASLTIIYELMFYRSNLALSFSDDECKANGKHVVILSMLDTVMTSLVIAVACNIVGSLLITCFISVPVAISLKIAKSNKQAILISVIVSFVCSLFGLFFAYSLDLHVGGTIVLTSIAVLIILFVFDAIKRAILRKKP